MVASLSSKAPNTPLAQELGQLGIWGKGGRAGLATASWEEASLLTSIKAWERKLALLHFCPPNLPRSLPVQPNQKRVLVKLSQCKTTASPESSDTAFSHTVFH